MLARGTSPASKRPTTKERFAPVIEDIPSQAPHAFVYNFPTHSCWGGILCLLFELSSGMSAVYF